MKTVKLEFVFEIGANGESQDTINDIRKEICTNVNNFMGINGVNAIDVHYTLIANDCYEYNENYT